MTERVIRVVLDDRGLSPKLDNIEGKMGGVERGAGRMGTSFRVAAVAAASLVAALGIREFVQYGDELIRLTNRLGTVTDSTQNLAAVQAELVELSFRTRTRLEDNVELFTRIAAATEKAGLSQRAMLEVTESLSIGLRIGGATTAEATGALIQFTQGLALGRFETQELRSVLEQSVPVSRALQKEFNATQGELLALAEAGELAADRVVEALRGDTLRDFRQQLEKLTPLASEGFGQFKTAVGLAIGELNVGLGVSKGIGDSFNDMAIAIAGSTIEIFEFGKGMSETFFIAIGLIDLTIAKFDTLGEEISLAIAEAREESGLLDDALKFLAEQSADTSEELGVVPTALSEAFPLVTSSLLVLGAGIRSLEDDTKSVTEAENELSESLTAQEEILRVLTEASERFERERAQRIRDREEFGVSEEDRDEDKIPGPNAKQTLNATIFLRKLGDELGRAKIETELFGEEAEAALLRFEAAANIEKNIGALADEINAATEALIEQNVILARAEELRANRADDADFIQSLEAEVALLGLTNEELARQTSLQELSKDATDAERESVIQLTDAITDADREEFIQSLQDELDIIRLAEDEREIEIALRELGAEATDEQKDAVRRLVAELENEKDSLNDFEKAVERFSENVGQALADTLFDGLRDGFDDIEDEFANFLQNLAKQLLASQLADLLLNLFKGSEGNIIGAVISGVSGRQTGGEATRGVPVVVGERRPELFVPSESGNILPDASSGLGMAPIIQNILDPENQLALIETARGRNVIRNLIQGDLDFYERILGQK